MYPVDQDLYNQTKADVQVPHLRGWIEDTIAFTENNILRDTFSINAKLELNGQYFTVFSEFEVRED